MRPVHSTSLAVAWLVFAAFPAVASDVTSRLHALTLLLQFEQPASDGLLAGIQRELADVMLGAGVATELRLLNELTPYQEFGDLVVVRMKGDCRLDARLLRRAVAGPLAFAHSSDGQILPFMEVLCDRIKETIRPVLWGDRLRRTEELLSRAIARVMAHELYHIVGQTCEHGKEGLSRHSLSGEQLIGDRLGFQPEEVQRMQNITAGSE